TTEPFDPATARLGAVVMFCADPDASASVERFFLSGDDCVRHHPRPDQPARYAELAKPLAALPGDTVVVARSGVRVNGRLLPASEPLAESRLGEPVTAALGRHVLGAGEYWVHSSRVPYSLDSRYYGPVDAVRGVLHPVLVWDP
ncbi:MAG: S26 family signal peptidase, partial [Myxococcota bacterium]